MNVHIGITGNIGAGKTTLMNALAPLLGALTYHEGEDENPFIARYYEDPQRWALDSTRFFLNRSCDNQLAAQREQGYNLQDRTTYDQLAVFGRYRIDQGLLTRAQAEELTEYANTRLTETRLPDLFLYLRVTPQQAQERVAERNRDYENLLSIELLDALHRNYEQWIKRPGIAERVFVLDDIDNRDPEQVRTLAALIRQRRLPEPAMSFIR